MQDIDWIRQSFLVTKDTFDALLLDIRENTTASLKFTDTTLGGNFAINTPPQFCRNADRRVASRNSESNGMGRFYSEAIDDNGQYVFMTFGVTQFNSLTNFFGSFYNTNASTLANRGRANSALYSMFVGTIAFVVSLPLKPFIWTGDVLRYVFEKPASKFYYLKPAMPLYWQAVSTIVNTLGTNMGIVGNAHTEYEEKIRQHDKQETSVHGVYTKKTSGVYPNIWLENGGVDIFKVSTRAQRLAQKSFSEERSLMESASTRADYKDRLIALYRTKLTDENPPTLTKTNGKDGILERFHSYTPNDGSLSATVQTAEGNTTLGSEMAGDGFENTMGYKDYLANELQEGSRWICFKVEATGSVQESFSNSTGESQLASKINSISASSRSTRFSFADGNIGDNPFLQFIEGIGSVLKGGAKALSEGVQMSGLLALAGSAFVDIPKVWQNSSAQLPSASYTMELRSPYGNPMSRFFNLIVPLSYILAAALPLATGKQSYTSPFLCEVFCRGRTLIRLGLIDSLSITRGTGNQAWTKNGEPLGIDVSFTVIDLTSVMYMPLISNFQTWDAVTSAAGGAVGSVVGGEGGEKTAEQIMGLLASSTWDDDNSYTDYLATLSSLSLSDLVNPRNKLRLRLLQRAENWRQWKSPARFAANTADWWGVRHVAKATRFTGASDSFFDFSR